MHLVDVTHPTGLDTALLRQVQARAYCQPRLRDNRVGEEEDVIVRRALFALRLAVGYGLNEEPLAKC